MNFKGLITNCVCAQLCLILQPHGLLARQAPLSMGILQAGILDWVALSSSRDLPNPGIKPESPVAPALAGEFFTTGTTWEVLTTD